MKYVALFTRAWIEILRQKKPVGKLLVALFTRAWIEIKLVLVAVAVNLVALFTRAWIEIQTITKLSHSFHKSPS